MEEQQGACHHHVSVKIVGIIVLGVVLVVALLQQAILPSTKTVTVVGQGRIPVKPDIAVLDLSMMTLKAADTKVALEETTAKVQKVQDALDQMGVAKEDRQLTGYSFNPVYDGTQQMDNNGNDVPNPGDKVIGYNGYQQLTVKIHGIDQDMQKIDRTIEGVLNAGANQVGDVHFVYSDIEKAKQDARLKAIADAQNKADTMVKTAGVKLQGIEGWSENVVSAPGQTYSEGSYGSYNNSTVTFNNENNPVTVNSNNQTEAIVEVTVNYRIK